MSIEKTLLDIQVKLKVLKDHRNEHGSFNFRSMEDINQALKPLLEEHEAGFIVTDELVQIGERYYVKATAALKTGDGEVVAHGYAREAEEQRGMNAAQITGSTSSYARKYAANGLFAIDDNKDADDYLSEEEVKLQDQADQQNAVDGLRKLILSLPIDKQKEALAAVLESADIKKIEDIEYREAKIQYAAISKRYDMGTKKKA